VARGDLPGPQDATVVRQGEGRLQFSWTYDAKLGTQRGNDYVLALAYHPERERGVWIADGRVLRKEQQLELNLPGDWAAATVAPYLAFAAADGTDASDSLYLG
jgi:hypothetical protein